MNPRILIIGLVWPEPTSSAAGWRMLQLIEQLTSLSNDIHFACAASKSDASFCLTGLKVSEHNIQLNHESFNLFVKQLNPEVVVYDRFLTEEQFGWRVKKVLPDIVTVLDTEDLHFVRRARAMAFKQNTKINYDTTDCYRELSSVYRCDLSVIISKTEYDLLKNQFMIPEKQLLYLPFIEKKICKDTINNLPDFSSRQHLMFIGNFIHEPNYQTVIQLKKMWQVLKNRLPTVELHIYGAYPSQKVMQLNNVTDRFLIKGKALNVNETMRKYRVLVAPIPFGAGLKGKFIDGFKNALPSVTTPIGAEGMNADNWAGFVVGEENAFINAVCNLYEDEALWNLSVLNGFKIINQEYAIKKWHFALTNTVKNILKNTTEHRNDLFVQKILWQNSLQAMKYMSLWIEQKNK